MNQDSSHNTTRSVTRGSMPENGKKYQRLTTKPLIRMTINDNHPPTSSQAVGRKHVHIIDRPCGTGKTTSILNSFRPGQKHLVVVPLLSEVDRVIRDAKVSFEQPEDHETTKSDDLERLLMEGVNVVTTHALFSAIAWASSRGLLDDYHIIIDEVLDVIQDVEGKSSTSFEEIYLKGGYATEGSDGLITPTKKWDETHMLVADTLDLGLYRKAKSRTLYRVDGRFFLWALPASLLTSGRSITVYTYMAEGSLMVSYLKKIGIPFSHERYPDDATFRQKARELITVRSIPALEKASLKFSYTGQTEVRQRAIREKTVSQALKNLKQRQLSGVTMSDVLITCAKQNWYKDGNVICGKPGGFSKGSRMGEAIWLPNTTRGTNNYAHASVCIYLYDQHINPYIKRWLGLAGDPGADDRYALTELIQWVYRSRVRRGLPITLYIPSKRMRDLFQAWLEPEGVSEEVEPLPMVA